TVATVAERQALGLSGDALYQELYYENLANNYIEAISRLNRSLVTVFRAADLADGRQADPNAILAQIQGAYDADAAGAVSIDGIVAIKQQATAAMADNGSTQLSAKGSQIRAVEEQTEKAQFEYAEAGRRSEALKQSLAVYLEAAAKPARDAFDAAQKKFDDLTVVERSLRDQYGVQNREYVNRLDQMADAFKKFLAANEEAELRRGVAEYAKTPYLYQSSTANNEGDATLLEKHKADAKEAYELAQRALDDVQSRMKDAAFAVQTQDRLELFASIAGKLQAGTTFAPLSADDSARLSELRDRQLNKHETLSAAEKTELDGLTERDLAERYADVFTARSEHILHTMRVVRLHKAQEIIKGEIEKRRAIAESQRQNFERVLAGAFPVNDSGKEARNAVYQRLAGIVEASGAFSTPALYNEYKSYFWSGQSWMQSFGGTYANASVQNLFPVKTPTVTISQQLEAAAGILGAAAMPVEDQKAMAQYVAANGQLLDFAGFSGVYYAFLQALGVYDTANLTDKITKSIYIPAQYTGYAMTYAGSQMMAAGAALLVLGAPLIARGAAMVAAGGAMVRTSTQMLVKSQMQLNFAQITALSMQKLALDSAGDTNIRKTMKAQEEYEKAEASLDYFTKIGDVETLKHRLIAFGSLRKDDDSTKALYTLTEEDLKYLVENGTSVDSTGASVTLTAQESSDALDGRNLQNDSEFRDSFGRRYSLTKPEITSPPGALSGGLYRAQDGTQYVRVRRVNDAGAEYFAYAKLESGTGTQKTYDAGRVLDALTTQGDQLRAERKAAYIAAEDAAGSQSGDDTFALRERDATYDMLFQAATGDAAGGREYSGYRITYADVAENADLVYRDQLNQRLNIQLQDWDIRAQQLNDQKADWEDRVSTIISRGKDSWNLAENRFAAEQRKWEADQKRSEEEGKKHWDEKTKEILAKKLAFEEEMAVKKAQADANTNLSSIIDTLNAEIAQFSQNTGIKKDSINKAEVLARIVDEIKSSVPTGANKLAELNSEVSKFNTRLEITELANSGNTQFDSKLASALANYDAELSDHAKNLRVLANVKVYQEYLALRNNIRQQIMDQNDAIDLQTQSAAAAAGFARSGASYIKRSAGGSVARIDAYVKMDADKAIRNAFGATGYEEMSDQSVTSLLKNANETEVEAFFYTQKLRLQAASEQIFGNGSQEARRGSRDAKIIGSLG
ncbi:MAG TPA: hypothetical protein PKX74_10520, partial [Leptospiraceae bacterium]|nr:hypothetical protein [Leptospiraceae bacterium]